MKSIGNENLMKLRELSDELCESFEYKVIVDKLRNIIDKGKIKVDSIKTPQSKMKCYENMCSEIVNILNTVKYNGK
jgi:hypothetical protein